MSRCTWLFRLLIVTVFAVGVGLPVASFARSAPIMPAPALHSMQMGHDAATPMPPDESCHLHCVGLSTLLVPSAPQRPFAREMCALNAAPDTVALSHTRQPEEHPPRLIF